MEFGTLELILGGFLTVITTGAVVWRILITQQNSAIDGERAARLALEKELRNDIKEERGNVQELRHKVQVLEQAKAKSDAELEETRKLMAAMRIELEQLQQFREKATAWLEDKDNTIDNLRSEVKGLERDNHDLAERNRDLTTANNTLKEAFRLAGLQRNEPEAAPEASETTEQRAGQGGAEAKGE